MFDDVVLEIVFVEAKPKRKADESVGNFVGDWKVGFGGAAETFAGGGRVEGKIMEDALDVVRFHFLDEIGSGIEGWKKEIIHVSVVLAGWGDDWSTEFVFAF